MNLRALYVTKLTGDLAIADCYLDGTYALNINIAGSTYKLTAQNTTFKGWTSYGPIASAEFTGCSFGWNSEGTYAHLRPYTTTTLNNCSFEKGFTMGVDEGKSVTIYLNDCIYDGQVVTAANFTSLLDCNDANGLKVNNCIVYVDGELVA